jgi:MarR family transcriptional regulator, organic hydroperoxide resistance regulator
VFDLGHTRLLKISNIQIVEYDLHVAIETTKRGTGTRDVAGEAWALLQRVAFSERPRFIAAVREFDLVPPHFIVLQELNEPKPMGEIAKLLACDSSNVTWITDRLEERGLVERQPDPGDRRVKLLVLTPEGRRMRDAVEARLEEPPPSIQGLSREDQKALRDILRRAAEHLS